MIYIDRASIEVPSILYSEKMIKLKNKLFSFHEIERPQERFNYNHYFIKNVKQDAVHLFQGKCAYCESIIDNSGEIDLFRPRSSAIQLTGKYNHGYWWLAYEWNNLYLCCPACNRNKRNRFPVEGNPISSPKEDINNEKYILIDPCAKADIEENAFIYNMDGEIQSTTYRGKVTIDLIGLNRTDLMRRRKKMANDLFHRHQLYKLTADDDEKKILFNYDSKNEFFGMQQFFLKEWNIDNKNTKKTTICQIKDEYRKNLSIRKKKDLDYDVYSINSKQSKEAYYQTVKLIKRIEIRNFKSIKHLNIDFPEASKSIEPWLVIIGDNGVGKSSLLQAISLTLCGENYLNKLELELKNLIRNAQGIHKATVKIFFTGLLEPINLVITKNDVKITPSDAKVLVLGYGATRMLPKKGSTSNIDNGSTNIGNLFDPYSLLKDVESWLSDPNLVSSHDFNLIASSLRELLLLPSSDGHKDTAIFRRRKGKITLTREGNVENLYDLCDGYKSVLAYVLDIMMSVHKRWPSIIDAEGIVLIDEIETHLHPTWKIKIVSLLRSIFPNLNFIITTHDPLCLRGARKNEVNILSFDDVEKEVKIENIDIPPGMPLDDLLLGIWFKMDSTLDESTTRLIKRHSELKLGMEKNIENELIEIERDLSQRMRFNGGKGLFEHYIKTLDSVLNESTVSLTEEQINIKIASKLQKKLGHL